MLGQHFFLFFLLAWAVYAAYRCYIIQLIITDEYNIDKHINNIQHVEEICGKWFTSRAAESSGESTLTRSHNNAVSLESGWGDVSKGSRLALCLLVQG